MNATNNDNGFCLSENLRALRRQMKWSQEELAERIGLKRGNIASYENGSAEPRICNLVKLAQIFHISVFDLTHTDLKSDEQLALARSSHASGQKGNGLSNVSQLEREAEDFQQAMKGLRCFFHLKVKNAGELPPEMQFMTEHFEQLYDVTRHLLDSHLQLLSMVKENCQDISALPDAAPR